MSGSPYVLAIDQGTTSTRAMLFDAQGQVRHTAQIELTQYYPRPGWVEHDPEQIWQSVVSTCREAAAAADGPIAAIGIANQRETTVLWDRATGRPVHNAIVWQDRRTAELCARWRQRGARRKPSRSAPASSSIPISPHRRSAGCSTPCPACANAPRPARLPLARSTAFCCGGSRGGARHATDVTNAARTMLFDIRRLAWDEELLDAFRIPRAILPEVLDTGADFGACRLPNCSALRSRSRRWPAISRRR